MNSRRKLTSRCEHWALNTESSWAHVIEANRWIRNHLKYDFWTCFSSCYNIQFKQRDKIQVNILPCAPRFYCSCIQISSCFHASITCVLSMNLLWHSIWQRNMAKRYSKCRKVFTLFESWDYNINCSFWIWRKLSIELNTAIYQFDQIRFHGIGERREEILWSHYFSHLLSALLLEFNHKCAGIVAYVVDFLVSMVVSWMILWW